MKNNSSLGWVELVLGVLLIIMGWWSFAQPAAVIAGLVIFFGIMAIVTGIADIVLYFKVERASQIGTAVSLIAGILSVIAGVVILIFPGASAVMLAIFFAIWFIAHCIARLANLGLTRRIAGNGYYWLSLIVNVIGVVLGVMLLIQPLVSALSLAFLVGLYLILIGVSSVVMAFGPGGFRS